MSTLYLGKLEYADPLYEILLSQVCPYMENPIFHVDRMASFGVYKYTEEKTRVAAIGKFFRLDDPKPEKISRIKGEYENLQKIRAYGFDSFPNYVVRPISKEETIGLALLEEYIHGKDLDYYLRKAIYDRDDVSLKERLSDLASFLYALHKKTGSEENVELNPISVYYEKVLNKLCKQEIISLSEKQGFFKLVDKWLVKASLQKGNKVIVHGDATPTNFIFTQRHDIVAIDLERMKNADPVFDIGMVCGEIKHVYFWRTGNPYRAEPFIRHFFESYSSHFIDDDKAFYEITLRNPFYMAMTELRIARNGYLDLNYRKRLVHEARKCLEWGLRLATGEIATLVKSVLSEKGFSANGSIESSESRTRGKTMPMVRKRKVWWESVPGARSYVLYLSEGREIFEPDKFLWEATPGIISKHVCGKTEVILPDDWPEFPKEAGTYYIGVTSKDEFGNQSDPLILSGSFKFVAPPAPSQGGIESL